MSSSVRIGKVPGRITSFFIEEDTTVSEALELAGSEREELKDIDGYAIRLDGDVVDDPDNTVVPDGASLTLVREVRGNG